MLAKVYVTLKKGVLDPQGKTVHRAAQTLGYRDVRDIRQGKYFEISLPETVSREKARQMVETLAREVLANPVIEDFRFELEGA